MFEARGGRRHSVTSDPLALTSKDWGSRDTGSPFSSDRTIICLCLRTHGTQHQDEDQEEADARKTEEKKNSQSGKRGGNGFRIENTSGEWMA